MGRRPLIAKQYRHFGYAELALCFQPQVRIYTLAIAAASTGFEAKLTDAAAHSIGCIVFA
jgi:hypothetical protein